MPTVFLSYARPDAQVVDRIASDLRRQGVHLWMDRQDLVAGQEWLPQIEQAISSADFMLVSLSKASLSSKWVQREYQVAFQSQARTGSTRLVPVLLERVDLPLSCRPFHTSILRTHTSKECTVAEGAAGSVGPPPRDVAKRFADLCRLSREAGAAARRSGRCLPPLKFSMRTRDYDTFASDVSCVPR